MSHFYTRASLPAHFQKDLWQLDCTHAACRQPYKGFVTDASCVAVWMDKLMNVCAKLEFDVKNNHVYRIRHLAGSSAVMRKFLGSFEKMLIRKTLCSEIRLLQEISSVRCERESLEELQLYESLGYTVYKVRFCGEKTIFGRNKLLRVF